MTKLIITLMVVGLIGVVAPHIYYRYHVEPIVVIATPEVLEVPIVYKTVVKHIKIKYNLPTGKVLEIAESVAKETGYSVDIISKIMFAESQYTVDAKHINKNKSVDSGLFQINSQHIPLAKSMGIDIMTPEGNAKFAIYLLKTQGLKPWGYSKQTWSTI